MKHFYSNETIIRFLFISLIAIAFVHPVFADLSTPPAKDSITIARVETIILDIIDWTWKIFVAVSIFMFLYAGFLFVTAAGNESQIGTARKAVIWAAVGIAVALIGFSVEAIIRSALSIP